MTTAPVELVSISDAIKGLDSNPKEDLGSAYRQGLASSFKRFNFKGTLTLTPRCTEAVPALCERYGADGKYIAADGNKRIELLPKNGWTRALILPGLNSSVGGWDFQAILAGRSLIEEYLDAVAGGERIAVGISYPDLDTPAQVIDFALGYDRVRARYDEKIVQRLLQARKDEGADMAELQRLAVQRLNAVQAVLKREEEARKDDPKALPAAELVKKRRAEREASLTFPVSIVFTLAQREAYQKALDYWEGKCRRSEVIVKVLEQAAEVGRKEDLLVGLAAQMAEEAWEVHEKDTSR